MEDWKKNDVFTTAKWMNENNAPSQGLPLPNLVQGLDSAYNFLSAPPVDSLLFDYPPTCLT